MFTIKSGDIEQLRDQLAQTQEFVAALFEMVTSGNVTAEAASEMLRGFYAEND